MEKADFLDRVEKFLAKLDKISIARFPGEFIAIETEKRLSKIEDCTFDRALGQKLSLHHK